MEPEPDHRRVVAARAIAVIADSIQLGLLPLFMEGALSTVNDVLDVAVAIALSALVGWHWAFVPSFFSELVPFFNLAPTWTAAVFFATRHSGAAVGPQPEQQPLEPPAKSPPGS